MTEPTEEKLREKIAIAGATAYFNLWEKLSQEEKSNWLIWAAKILALKEEKDGNE